jgi:hypothetical protein
MESPVGLQLERLLADRSPGEIIDMAGALEGIEEHAGFKVILDVLEQSREFALRTLIHAPHATENAAALQKQLGIVKGLEGPLEVVPTIRRLAETAREIRARAAEAADAERQEA